MVRAKTGYFVVPCYNEEEILAQTHEALAKKLEDLTGKSLISRESRILYVDDGSTDHTWQELKKIALRDPDRVSAIRFARNEGHQNALLGGMKEAYAYADFVVTIDADLQQDLSVLEEFIEHYDAGKDIVFGVRNSRKTDGFFKKTTASLFYGLMRLLGTETIQNHADYRLMSKAALTALFEYPETQLFLRGMIASMGFDTGVVRFEVQERTGGGKTRYSLRKMLGLAVNGITSMSIRPLQAVFLMGIVAFIISIFMIIYNVSVYLKGITVPGWTSSLCSVWLLGGCNLIGTGLLGEYVGKTYLEAKHRPMYFIKERIHPDEQNRTPEQTFSDDCQRILYRKTE